MDYILPPTALDAVGLLFRGLEAAEQLPGQALRLVRTITRADAAELGHRLRQGAGLVAAALVLAVVVVADLLVLARQAAALTYEAGFRFGTLVHRLNDQLAARWVALVAEPAAPVAAPARVTLALPPAPAPLALLAPACLVVAEPESAPVAPAPDHFGHLPNMVTPLEQARQLVATGTSVRQAARRCGISRTTLQRRLMAA